MNKGLQVMLQHNAEIVICSKCHLRCKGSHQSRCKGDSTICDVCGYAIANTYHTVRQHYVKYHGGILTQRGKLRLKQSKPKPRKVFLDDDVIIVILVPQGNDMVRCVYNRAYREWVKMLDQGNVWNTKDFDQFCLMCAIQTFKLAYIKT